MHMLPMRDSGPQRWWLPGGQSRWGGCAITTVPPSGAVSEGPSTVQESLLLSGLVRSEQGHYKIKTRKSEDRHMKSGTKWSAY